MAVVGIIRRLDSLGRITLPKEYRKYLGIKPLDEMQIILEEDKIILKPVKRGKKNA